MELVKKELKINNKSAFLVIGLFIITLILLILVYQNYGRKSLNVSQETLNEQNETREIEGGTKLTEVEISPTNQPPTIPSGSLKFQASVDENSPGPKFGQGELNPADPQKGQKQNFKIELADSVGVTKAEVILSTDNEEKDYPLKLAEGDSRKGIWQAEWIMNDSYQTHYFVIIKAYNKKNESKVTITLR